MSLYKQLWLAILFLMSLAFIGSFIVSSMSAKTYLEEQLSLKNIDNANSLALTIANTAINDVTTKLMISAQFDTGHYQYIRLYNMDGNTIIENIDNHTLGSTPDWFTRILRINSQEGVAQIQRGWQQVGTLTLKSHDIFAYQALWSSSVRLFNYCIGLALIGGIVGTVLLKMVLRPLSATVAQAEAISNHQFVIVDEPRTQEFKDLVRSMNSMSLHIKTIMEEESARLSRLQKSALYDEVTNLPNRVHFLNILASCLESDDNHSFGVLVLVRLQNLTELNRVHGRLLVDLLLGHIGNSLLEQVNTERGWKAGRLNGSDFVVIATGEHEPDKIAYKIQKIMISNINENSVQTENNLPTAASVYHPQENMSMLLSKVDAALASAEQLGGNAVEVAGDKTIRKKILNVDNWRDLLADAFENNRFSLAKFPVINKHNSLLHNECPARLTTQQGSTMNGGQFIPWINRFNLGIDLDNKIIDLALKELETSTINLCINLSAQAINSKDFLSNLSNQLSKQPDIADRLWMEVPEHSVYRNLPGFKQFCHTLKPLGCHIGIEHIGHHISQIGEIHDLGLDYIKIDASITRQVETTPAHQVLLRGLCMIVHSVGLIAIAEGVQEQQQWDMLKELGADGATGPLVTTLLASS